MKEIIETRVYKTKNGKKPLNIWLDGLEVVTRAQIERRLTRLRGGNFGICRALQEGLWELIIDYGPGYRIYYTKLENTVVLLVYAGSKRNQSRDIEKAKEYWLDYKERENL